MRHSLPNDWQSTAADLGIAGGRGLLCLASHPEAPKQPGDVPRPRVHLLDVGRDGKPSPNSACQGPEVPLALSVGMRTWLGVVLGFVSIYLFIYFQISSDASWHHGTFEKGFAS